MTEQEAVLSAHLYIRIRKALLAGQFKPAPSASARIQFTADMQRVVFNEEGSCAAGMTPIGEGGRSTSPALLCIGCNSLHPNVLNSKMAPVIDWCCQCSTKDMPLGLRTSAHHLGSPYALPPTVHNHLCKIILDIGVRPHYNNL